MTRKMRITFVLAFACAFMLAMMSAAKGYDTLLERQVTYRYIDEALIAPDRPRNAFDWREPTRALVRPFTTTDQVMVERRMNDAWASFAAAQDTGETHMLGDWFGGAALSRAEAAVVSAYNNDTRMVALRHSMAPAFYHLDGSLLQLDSRALTVRYASNDTGLAQYQIGHDAGRSTLVNRSTGWHVTSHERFDHTALEQGLLPVSDMRLDGINYYPAAHQWTQFWRTYDHIVTETDFGLIRELGANSVRIFLPLADFVPGPQQDQRLRALRDLLYRAEQSDLQVIPTLFDLKSGYATSGWATDVAYLDAVLPVLAAAPNVALIDLKNEADLDFDHHGKGHVLAWLKTMGAITRMVLPDTPLTVGWSSAEAGENLIDQLDVITYHEYADLHGTAERLATLRQKANGKPVLVTEIGASAWSLTMGFPGSAASQADALSQRIAALSDADGIFVWTLHDFPDPDPQAIGSSIWVRGLQSAYGLYDDTGHERPSADLVRQAFMSRNKGEQK